MIERTGGGVAGLHQLLEGSAVGSSFRGRGRLRVSGLVPDDVPVVMLARRDGSAITVPVRDHLYAIEVAAQEAAELPAEVVFALAGASRRFTVPGADDGVLDMRAPAPPL